MTSASNFGRVDRRARERAQVPSGEHPAAALSTACGTDDRPLTLPLASWRDPSSRRGCQDTRTAAAASASTQAACSARSAFARQVLLGRRFRVTLGARHRAPGGATEEPASNALSPLDALARAARPRPHGSHREGCWATRLLSSSAIETIREHDYERSEPRSPRTRSPACEARSGGTLSGPPAAGWPRPLSGTASRGFTGQGLEERVQPAPPFAIAREGSFAPT